MAQNITLWGASYSSVPSVTLPKTGGGTASFTDVTDTTATASDVATGKYFYTAAGVRTEGTNSGGGGGGGLNVQAYIGYATRTANSYGATTVTLTVAKTGTYNVSWSAWKSSSSGTMGTNLHVNTTTGTNQTTWLNTYGQHITLTNQHYNAGDVLTLYATSGNNSRTIGVCNLIIEQTS